MISDSEVYARLGDEGFERLVNLFYAAVRQDDLIGPMYPPQDLDGARVRLRDFLVQRFGGPMRYDQTRGHPRLRMRHGPFSIGQAEARRWLTLMAAAMRDAGIDDDVAAVLWPYFVSTAGHMMNRAE
ncbi:MAG TPA: globin [Tepidisphaeraceae bacterium]|jgi:hemoglobin